MSSKYSIEDFKKVHDALHSDKMSVVVGGKEYKIMKRSNNCRAVKLEDGPMVMEQNKTKNSSYAERARNGEHISWIMKGPSWGYIDDKIIRL
tara:strand:- start:548 stop:823 length:276 start_codon:yes stop_codon:yes gene_type:complete